MVLSNKKNVTRKMNFLFLLIFIIFCTTVVGIIIKSLIKYSYRLPLFILMIILTVIIFKWIKSLRVFEFENIGSTFTIKYYHPLKRGIIFPYLEFPIENVTHFQMEEKRIKSNVLKINILLKEKDKILRFKLKVSNLSKNSYKKMKKSFTHIPAYPV